MAFLMKLCLWALAFVPLIVNSSTFFPFIFGKVMLIRIFISLISVLFTVHLFASGEFRSELSGKLKRVVKNPLFISLSVFMAIFAIGTVFAVNPFRAFFGDVERGEGLLGFLYFYGFFFYSLLLFEKKDWLMFFKLNLFSGLALFLKELAEMGTDGRPGSFTGNPAFLGGYFLFVVFSSLLVFYYAKKEPIWKAFACLMLPISVVGLFITETRAAMLGLVMGSVALIVYGFFHGKQIFVKKDISLRVVSMWLLVAMIAIGGIFFTTKSSPVWQKVPGFNRVAQFTLQDFTVQTRLISLGVSIKAIEPANNGMQKFLIGWGPENFSTAYNQYYNPAYYHLEHTWFDRAHDKLMDVAVMNGILGLFAYLAMWGSVIWIVFRRKGFSFDMMAIIFFGIAFFFNLLFLFDQISTVIPLFGFFAFVIYAATLEEGGVSGQPIKRKGGADATTPNEYVAYGAASIATLFFLWGMIFWTLVPMSQMSNYLSAFSDKNVGAILQQPDAVFEPYTFAQQDIRSHFLNIAVANYGNPQIKPIFDLALAKMEDLIQREPKNPRYLLMLGGAYDRMGKADKNPEYFKKAGAYYEKALEFAPQRQDVVFAYALNLSYQNRIQEGITLLRKELAVDTLSPETHYYLGILLASSGSDYKESLKELEIAMQSPTFANTKEQFVIGLYRTMMKRAYEARDKERFLVIAKRLETIDPEQAENVKKVEAAVEKGQWPPINFQ